MLGRLNLKLRFRNLFYSAIERMMIEYERKTLSFVSLYFIQIITCVLINRIITLMKTLLRENISKGEYLRNTSMQLANNKTWPESYPC